MYSIGVDIGGSHITACIYDHQREKLLSEYIVNQKVNTKGTKDEILRDWVRAISHCRDMSERYVEGVGIAMPGPFDYYNGISLIQNLDKLSTLYNENIRANLSNRLNMEPMDIRFINDATAFSIAETTIGKAREAEKVVAITLGTGLGASFVYNGKPVIKSKNVPEGGFLYNQYYLNELADDLFSTRGILLRYTILSGKSIKNVRELCELVPNDIAAKTTLEQFGYELGDFLYSYLNDFNADLLCIGGNIAKAYPYFGKSLESKLDGIEVCISELGEKAAIIGGALLMDDPYYNSVKSTLKLM